MKLKTGYMLRQVAGQYMVVPMAERSGELHGMLTLNESGAFLWELLTHEQTEQSLIDALLEAYDVTEAVARQAVGDFVAQLQREQVLQ